MRAHSKVPASLELPLGEPDEFSLTPAMVAKKKEARRAGMEILKHATEDQRPVSSLTSVAARLHGCLIEDRAKNDFEIAIEVARGDWK